MIKDLIDLANNLDSLGYPKEANYLDLIIKKIAADETDAPTHSRGRETHQGASMSECEEPGWVSWQNPDDGSYTCVPADSSWGRQAGQSQWSEEEATEEDPPEDMLKPPKLIMSPGDWSTRGRRKSREEKAGRRVLEFLLFVDRTNDAERNKNIANSLSQLRGDTFNPNLLVNETGRLVEHVEIKTSIFTRNRSLRDEKGIEVNLWLGPLASGASDLLDDLDRDPSVDSLEEVRRKLEIAIETKLGGGANLTLQHRPWDKDR